MLCPRVQATVSYSYSRSTEPDHNIIFSLKYYLIGFYVFLFLLIFRFGNGLFKKAQSKKGQYAIFKQIAKKKKNKSTSKHALETKASK